MRWTDDVLSVRGTPRPAAMARVACRPQTVGYDDDKAAGLTKDAIHQNLRRGTRRDTHCRRAQRLSSTCRAVDWASRPPAEA